jgi:hypothetical protein
LVVNVRGRERSVRFLSDLHIPPEQVQDVEADPEIEHTLWRGWRIPGATCLGSGSTTCMVVEMRPS